VLRVSRDPVGRCCYFVERMASGECEWVTAESLPQRLVCEYENAPRLDGTPAHCANAMCP
jgi:hypothetical protein